MTLAVLMLLIAPAWRHAALTRGLAATVAVAALFEVFYVTLQSARGRASHFNFETLPEALGYVAIMGVGALAIVGATAGVGLVLARHPVAGLGRGLHLGAVLGLVVGSTVTLAVAGPMAAGLLGATERWVGGSLSHADGLPLVGWSTTGGDLRVPHFIATHMMQALPLVGLVADRVAPRRARALVYAATALMLALVVATWVQAMAGLPLLALPGA